jgi:hypothetical protein
MTNEADSKNKILRWWRVSGILGGDTFTATTIFPIFSLLVISVSVYGVFIMKVALWEGNLGFYHDDWPIIWVYNALGQKGLEVYFAGNRPFSGWIYSVIFGCIGFSTIAWHVLALVVRWLSSVVLFIIFRTLWPSKSGLAWLISVLVLLYPGFSQQSLSITFVPQHVSLLLFSISLVATIWSLRFSRIYWYLIFTIISLVTALLGYLIIEYFIGLEFLRPLLILFILRGENKTKLSSMAKVVIAKWAPYAICLFLLSVWRVFLFHTLPPAHDGLAILLKITENPFIFVTERFLGEIRNILMATVLAWSRTLSPELFNYHHSKSVQLSWVIGVFASVTVLITLIALKYSHRKAGSILLTEGVNGSNSNVVILGLLATILGGLPNVFPGLHIEYSITGFSINDRFTLPYSIGSSLVLAGLLYGLRISNRQRAILLSVLIFSFSAFQIRNGAYFKEEWKRQRSMLWQIAWRLPFLEQGTTIFVDPMPQTIRGNHSAGLLNMLYNADDSTGQLDYFFGDPEWATIWDHHNPIPGRICVFGFKPGEPISGNVRTFVFRGSTSKSLAVWNAPSGTLRIVDRRYSSEIPGLPPGLRSIVHLSKFENVMVKKEGLPIGPLLQILGSEPTHEWAYYYQKAELAREFSDWQKVSLYGDEVRHKRYMPRDQSEWFPFIEAYAMTGRYDLAAKLTEEVLDASPYTLIALSNLWQRIVSSGLRNSQDFVEGWNAFQEKLMLSGPNLVTRR